MIKITKEARDFIVNKGFRAIYLDLTYVKGPCADNLCKAIPKVAVSAEKHSNSYLISLDDPEIKVYAVPPIAASINRHNDTITISKSRVGDKLKVSGMTYSF